MADCPFGLTELFCGNRFLAPLSESALLEAGRAAGFHAGETLLEVDCGTGGAALLFAEEFHLYARGLDVDERMIGEARDRARRSPARHRVRYYLRDGAAGPVDILCAFRGNDCAASLLRPGGRRLVGRFVALRDEVPDELSAAFPLTADAPSGEILWRRSATPLEWERFFAPQERALRVYRRTLRVGDRIADLALAADRSISAFRAHGSFIGYELTVAAS
ncbi:MAG: SAM-dependent methyltransferase [Planctomycetota bacterium]|jgi:SAM-dependent methyltransferase